MSVSVRFDFLDLSPVGEEVPGPDAPAPPVPHQVSPLSDHGPPLPSRPSRIAPHGPSVAFACLPLRYIPEPRHRIEMYRKLAQVTAQAGLETVRSELRDRFGALPPAVELLLQVAALKILAAERGLQSMETRDDRLMLTRNGQFIQVGGRFPRLTKRTAGARLNEIRKVLLALEPHVVDQHQPPRWTSAPAPSPEHRSLPRNQAPTR